MQHTLFTHIPAKLYVSELHLAQLTQTKPFLGKEAEDLDLGKK